MSTPDLGNDPSVKVTRSTESVGGGRADVGPVRHLVTVPSADVSRIPASAWSGRSRIPSRSLVDAARVHPRVPIAGGLRAGDARALAGTIDDARVTGPPGVVETGLVVVGWSTSLVLWMASALLAAVGVGLITAAIALVTTLVTLIGTGFSFAKLRGYLRARKAWLALKQSGTPTLQPEASHALNAIFDLRALVAKTELPTEALVDIISALDELEERLLDGGDTLQLPAINQGLGELSSALTAPAAQDHADVSAGVDQAVQAARLARQAWQSLR